MDFDGTEPACPLCKWLLRYLFTLGRGSSLTAAPSVTFLFLFETESQVAQAGLEIHT